MIRISPFTPLFFNPSTDGTGQWCRYVQTFSPSDHIFLEILAEISDVAPYVELINHISGVTDTVTLDSWNINATTIIYHHIFKGLPLGCYTVKVDGVESELFQITDDANVLAETTLLQYSMKDNRSRTDVAFNINNVRYFFDFRIPGGFKDNGWTFSVEGEQFVTSQADIIPLFALESTQKMLTVGGQIGCPIWFAEMLNRLLCCDYVYVEGERFCRKETSVPEVTETIEGSRSFVFKQLLQKVVYTDPKIEDANLLQFRRVEPDYRCVDSQDETLNLRSV